MSPMTLKARLLTAAATIAVAAPLATSSALAAGFALKEQSVSGQGTAYAGVTAGGNGDASAMYYNPATMGLISGNQIVQTASGIFVKAKVEDARATRATRLGGSAISGNASPGDIAQDAVVPAGYFVYSVNDDLKLGLAANSPWGLVTNYGSNNWIGRYHGIRSDLRTYNFTPSVSYRINPMFTVGGGVQVQYAKAKLSQASDFGASRLGRPGALDVFSDVTGDDWGWGYTLGALIQPSKDTRIGLAFRSSVKHSLTGTVSFTGLPASLASALPTQRANAELITPEIASIGLYHEVNDRWAVMADAQWTNWSRFKELRVNVNNPALNSVTEEKWKDTWYFALGTSYKVTDDLTLRGGIAFDKGAVDIETRTPRIPEQNRYWLSVGAGYRLTESLYVDAAYSHVFIPSTSIHLTDDLTGPEAGRGNLSANYKSSIDIFGLQARLTF